MNYIMGICNSLVILIPTQITNRPLYFLLECVEIDRLGPAKYAFCAQLNLIEYDVPRKHIKIAHL